MNNFETINENEATKFDTGTEKDETPGGSGAGGGGGASTTGGVKKVAGSATSNDQQKGQQSSVGGGVIVSESDKKSEGGEILGVNSETDSNRARTPYREESMLDQTSRASHDRNYITQYARAHHQDTDTGGSKESAESRREARPRFPSLSTGLNAQDVEIDNSRYQQRNFSRQNSKYLNNSNAPTVTPRQLKSAIEKNKLKRSYSIDRARGYMSETQRTSMIKRLKQMKSEQQIVHNSSLVLAGGVPVKHSKRALVDRSRRMHESESSSRLPGRIPATGGRRESSQVDNTRHMSRRPSVQTMQTGVSAGWYTMGMYGCGIDLPLQFVKPPSVPHEASHEEDSVLSGESAIMRGSHYSRRRVLPNASARDSRRCSTGVPSRFEDTAPGYRQGAAGATGTAKQSIRSQVSRNNMSSQSSYVPVTIAPDGASLFSVMPMAGGGRVLDPDIDDDVDTILSRDVVHSYSTADSQLIPSLEDEYMMHGPEPKHKMSCEEIRYLIAIFIIRFVHTGFLDLDLISFTRAMDETGHDGMWFISVRFASSCLTSMILICWFCKCYGTRLLHMRSWVSVFAVTVFNAMGYLWIACDSFAERVQLYLFLVLAKGIFYCEGGAITALIMCVVFSPQNYKVVRAMDLLGIIAGDMALGCFCSQIYQTFKLEWTSVTMSGVGIVGTLILAFLVPFKRPDAISIIAARQGILRDKFKEFGQLLKIPQVLISCFMYITINLVLYAGGFIYNLYFSKVYGADLGDTIYTVYWALSSGFSLALTLILGFIQDPGKRVCYLIMWVSGSLPILFCYLFEPPEGAEYAPSFHDSYYVKVIGLVIMAALTVPFRIFSMCVVRYYVIQELFVSACLLLNLADNLGRCICPILLQVFYNELGPAWANLTCCISHLVLVIADIVICTIDWKRSKKLEKLLEKEEEELRLQEEAELAFEEEEKTAIPEVPPLEAINEESDHGMRSGEKMYSQKNDSP